MSTLQQVHIVMRHGCRTPVDTYPNDPHINEQYFPYGWGELTNKGKLESYKLGLWLRKRYDKFIAKQYTAQTVHAQSTGVSRTQMTLQIILAGWFAPKGTSLEWNRAFNWQPIPITYQPLNEDTLLLIRKPCARYYEAVKEVFKLPAVEAEIKPYRRMFEELQQLTGMPIREPDDVQTLYFTLKTQQEFGLKLPAWTSKYFPLKMKFLAKKAFIYNVYTTEMQKLKAGPFLSKMFRNMQAQRYGADDADNRSERRKVYLYVGHDSTIANILHALQLWKPQIPRYLAMIIFELHRKPNSNDYYVEIFFRKKTSAPLRRLTLPGACRKCPIDYFINFTKHLITKDDNTDCNLKNQKFEVPPQKSP